MKAVSKIMLGGAAMAALVSAAPAAAQYPGYGDPYSGYGYGYSSGGNVVGQIINSVLGYGRYPYGNYGYGQPSYMSSQVAINQCARAAEARINGGGYGAYGAYGSNGYGYGNGYGGYGNGYGGYGGYGSSRGGQVLGINSVEIRGYNRIKVVGVASSGRNYDNPYGYGGYAYNRSYGVPDLKFVCNADRSGRVYEVRIKANDYRR